nr:universal stress protein [Hymenobacter sp. BT523]
MPSCGLHKVVGEEPAPGLLHAVADLEADWLALLDLGHGLWHKLFSGSVIDQVLRRTPVPVLLLTATQPTPEPAPLRP